jgi:RNA polymerase sigma-70 factor (ECF subfamily)
MTVPEEPLSRPQRRVTPAASTTYDPAPAGPGWADPVAADTVIADIVIIEVPVVAAEPPDADFDSFYRSRRARIAKALAFALGDVDLAAEATDEAFVRAYERWAKVQRLDRPEAWVYRVASNWATSVLRRRRRSPHRFYEPDLDGPAVSDPAVHAAVAGLDVKHRSVVVCRYLLGWSVAETATALGLRQGTVKSRLHRAAQTLQSALHHLDPKEQR